MFNNLQSQIRKIHALATTARTNTGSNAWAEPILRLYRKAVKTISFAWLLFMSTCVPCMADVTTATLGDTDIVTNMIGIILLVFRIIGIVMVVYSIGALILAFKNEDPDSKTKNTSMMVISIILIFLETFVNASGILDKLA